MIRDYVLWVSETLFYVMDGVSIISTAWILAWVALWTIFMAYPLLWKVVKREEPSPTSIVAFILTFVFGLFTAMSPIAQVEMMSECRNHAATVNYYVDDVLQEESELTVTQCRVKDNYYGEFGEWKTRSVH